MQEEAKHLVLFDGLCGLCDRVVQFILRHDRRGDFLFAPLQSGLARELLAKQGICPQSLSTVYVIAERGGPEERILSRSDAMLFVLSGFGGGWKMLARSACIFPRRLRDFLYDWIARHRYGWFGRYEQCVLPSEEYKSKFLA